MIQSRTIHHVSYRWINYFYGHFRYVKLPEGRRTYLNTPEVFIRCHNHPSHYPSKRKRPKLAIRQGQGVAAGVSRPNGQRKEMHSLARPWRGNKQKGWNGHWKGEIHGKIQGLANVSIEHHPTMGIFHLQEIFVLVMWNQSPKRDMYQPLENTWENVSKTLKQTDSGSHVWLEWLSWIQKSHHIDTGSIIDYNACLFWIWLLQRMSVLDFNKSCQFKVLSYRYSFRYVDQYISTVPSILILEQDIKGEIMKLEGTTK